MDRRKRKQLMLESLDKGQVNNWKLKETLSNLDERLRLLRLMIEKDFPDTELSEKEKIVVRALLSRELIPFAVTKETQLKPYQVKRYALSALEKILGWDE